MGKVTFLNPEFLWLFLVLPIAIGWLFYINTLSDQDSIEFTKKFQATHIENKGRLDNCV